VGEGISKKAAAKRAKRERERRIKSPFGEFGPSGDLSLPNSFSNSDAVRARGVNLAARIGVKHL